jgi:hypothetical protein
MRSGPIGAMLAVLAACSAPAAPPQTTALAPPPGFDGSYRATIVSTAIGTGLDQSWCRTTGETTLRVLGNEFRLVMPHPNIPGNPTVEFVVDIAPNGMFQSQASTGIFAGQISGARLQGIVNGPGCQYDVTATRMF